MRLNIAIMAGLAGILGVVGGAAVNAATITYGWENGACVLGTKSNPIVTNVTADANNFVHAGSRSLKLVDNFSGVGNTSEAMIAWVQGLHDGDQVTASIWCYDTTPSADGLSPPSGRLWAYYNDNPDNVRSDNGYTGEGSSYSGAHSGWNLITATWTISGGHGSLVIEMRTYSDGMDTIWVDDLTVTAPSTATAIIIPDVSISGDNQTIVTSIGAADQTITLAGSSDAVGTMLTWTIKPDAVDAYAMGGLIPVSPTYDNNECTIADAGNGADLTDITNPYALVNNGNEVRFHTGGSGIYKFTYYVESPTRRSPDYTVLVGVQAGRAVITEIMFRPNNAEPDRGAWQWVEIKNVGPTSINLDSLQTPSMLNSPNLQPLSIPAEAKRILLAQSIRTNWLAEWNDQYRPTPPAVAQIATTDLILFPEGGTGALKPFYGNEDTLFLSDWNGELLDAVRYRDGADGWPAHQQGASLFLEDGKCNAADNDNGANWRVSRPFANNAYQTMDTFGNYGNDADHGSPMRLPDGPTVVTPVARNVYVTLAADGTAYEITLNAVPEPPTSVASYAILTMPVAQNPTSTVGGIGTLVDPDPQGGLIASAPYTLQNGGNVVHFTPARSGVFTFEYQAADTQTAVGNIARVTLYVQAVDTVYVTEILNNPRNAPASDWKWIEIYNPTATAIQIGSLTDTNDQFAGNLPLGTSIGANKTMILVPDVVDGRSRSEFLQEWARPTGYAGPALQAADVVWVPEDRFPSLSSTASSAVRVYATTGELLDAVRYGADQTWPDAATGGGILLKPTKLGSVLNDAGTNWRASAPDEFLAYASVAPTSDVGSPAAVPIGYPEADDLTVTTTVNHTPIDIQLTRSYAGLTYVIAPLEPVLPTAGFGEILLIDPDTGAFLTEGGTLAGHSGIVRLLLDDETSGSMRFTYHVLNDTRASNEATVNVYVQKGTVIITEIMYDPANEESAWEWVELTNLTGDTLMLQSMYDSERAESHFANLAQNDTTRRIPPHGTLVLAPGDETTGDTAGRTGAEFLNAWSLPTSGAVIWVPTWPELNNGGDTLLVFEAGGHLLDVVEYHAGGGWPISAADTGSESIYLDCTHFAGDANDRSENWLLSVIGRDGAHASGLTISDLGSPGETVICSAADFDADGDVDRADFDFLAGCALGPEVPVPSDCLKASLDGDSDVDAVDFGIFQCDISTPW